MNKDKRDLWEYFLICFWFFVIVIIAFVTLNAIFTTDNKVWLDGNAWATIIIGDLSASCTIFLGFVSYWQNKKQRQDYQKREEKLEKLEAKILEMEKRNK